MPLRATTTTLRTLNVTVNARGNWEVPDPNARGVIHGVRDRGGRADVADFADPLRPDRVRVEVLFGNDDRFDRRDVRVHRDVIVFQVVRDDPTGPVVGDRV